MEGEGWEDKGSRGGEKQGRWERGEERQSVRVGKVDGRCEAREGKGKEGKGVNFSGVYIYPTSVYNKKIPEFSKVYSPQRAHSFRKLILKRHSTLPCDLL